jgi:hypothetical protein
MDSFFRKIQRTVGVEGIYFLYAGEFEYLAAYDAVELS